MHAPRRLRPAYRRLAAALFPCLALAVPRAARAESGQFNLHFDVGVPLMVRLDGGDANVGYVAGDAVFDWQLRPPFALEAIVGGGYLNTHVAALNVPNTGWFFAGVGGRHRFLDNRQGYANEPHGDLPGHGWVAAHIAGHDIGGDGALGLDAEVGYALSVVRPLQIGVFLRVGYAYDFVRADPNVVFGMVGLTFAIELGHAAATDSDGDGLSNEREEVAYHTNPHNPDTDGDGLTDGDEVRRGTDPLRADTDAGGVNDGWEVAHPPHDPRNPADDDVDHDGVGDDHDACPRSRAHTEVDARGCAVLHERLVLEGITFEFNSATIQAASEEHLREALAILEANPTVRVEVGGYTDDQGPAAYNLRLSEQRAQAVRAWLVAHGVPTARITAHGYGAASPRASNSNEAGRAQNRRIEFRRLDVRR